MAEVVNLRLIRKSKERKEASDISAKNRAVFGISKADKKLNDLRAAKAAKDFDGHKRKG